MSTQTEPMYRASYYAYDSPWKIWHWYSAAEDKWNGPCATEELHVKTADGEIDDGTRIAHEYFPKQELTYSFLKKHNTKFTFRLDDFIDSRRGRPHTILSGPNNCGKSFLLKALYYRLGQDAIFLPCGRFQNVSTLTYTQIGDPLNLYTSFSSSFLRENQNTEDSKVQLQALITVLSSGRRAYLFDLAEQLMGMKFSIELQNPDNEEFSPKYVAVDGEPLSYSSTGTRLMLTLLGLCLNESFKIVLIDEPELGLNPGVQSIVADLIFNAEKKRMYLGHLERIYIATHSHVFLDHIDMRGNVRVSRNGNLISAAAVESVNDLHQLQFNLLGNRLETLFLPSLIVIVEGKADQIFLRRILLQTFPASKISVIRADGEGRILEKLRTVQESLGDLATSPYRDRLFVILDSVHSVRLVPRMIESGVREGNIVVWKNNGIEYVYPKSVMASIFLCGDGYEDQELHVDKQSEQVEMNGTTKGKIELARLVEERIGPGVELSKELDDLLEKVRNALAT